MQEIEVARGRKLKAGYVTKGILREKAFESQSIVVSRTRVASGAVSGWHHHGARHLYAFIVTGHLRLEYGLRGKKAVVLKPADFVHVPPRIVHRDVNSAKAQELVVVNFLVGKGTPVVNVQGPQSERVQRRKPRED